MRTPVRARRDGALSVVGADDSSRIKCGRWRNRNQIDASATYGDENSERGPRARADDSPVPQLRDIAREPLGVHGARATTSAAREQRWRVRASGGEDAILAGDDGRRVNKELRITRVTML